MERTAKATPQVAREHNERLVVATVYVHGRISRADLARVTGLTRTTVSDVVERLVASGLVAEAGRGPSTGGKAPILLEMPARARLLIGVDLGDQVFTAAVVDLRGRIVRRASAPSEGLSGEEAGRLALAVVDSALAHGDAPILGVGVGAPGLIDTGTGTVIRSVTRDWRDLPLGQRIAEHTGLPVHVANDCQAAVFAEHVFGSAPAANLIAVKVGMGIGAGLILGGELFTGDGFGAGEIGHTIVHPDGEACRCGRRGCLETVASLGAILRGIEARTGQPASLDQALDAFAAGDPDVREVVLGAGRELGYALAGLVGALHVRRFVIAGTLAAFGPDWLDAISAAMAERTLEALAADVTVELGRVDDVVVLGAAALMMTRELGLRLQPLDATMSPVRGPRGAAR